MTFDVAELLCCICLPDEEMCYINDLEVGKT